MAKPRIFLSSTFYDLKHVRNDLEKFVRDLGYDPVLSERGHVPYGRTETPEKYCYKEISNCDMLIHLIGSRFGSQSSEEIYSVSQVELRTAHKLNRQIYVFVERAVHFEYRTFLKNESTKGFAVQYVDDPRIYRFIKEVYALGLNNPIFDFESVRDITDILKEQWAGLFQRFLQQESRFEEYKISTNLKSTAEALAKIVEYTTKERDDTIKTILIHSHPVFNQIAQATGIRIHIMFSSLEEMETFLTTFGYAYRTLEGEDPSWMVFEQNSPPKKYILRVSREMFSVDGKLLPVEHGEWEKVFVRFQTEELPSEEDDVPF